MVKQLLVLLLLAVCTLPAGAQSKKFDKLKWLSGTWSGTGAFQANEREVRAGKIELAYNADSLSLSLSYGKEHFVFRLTAEELGQSIDLTADGKALRVFIAGEEYASTNRNFYLALAGSNEVLVSIVYTRTPEKYCMSGFLGKY